MTSAKEYSEACRCSPVFPLKKSNLAILIMFLFENALV
jgi:hypothetical protein